MTKKMGTDDPGWKKALVVFISLTLAVALIPAAAFGKDGLFPQDAGQSAPPASATPPEGGAAPDGAAAAGAATDDTTAKPGEAPEQGSNETAEPAEEKDAANPTADSGDGNAGDPQTKDGIAPLATGDQEVSDWETLKAAIENPSITRIIFSKSIQRSGGASSNNDLPLIKRNLEIDARGFTLDFRDSGSTSVIDRPGIKLAPSIAAQFTMKNITISRPGTTSYSVIGSVKSESPAAYAAYNESNLPTSSGWSVTLENLQSSASSVPEGGLISVPNGKVSFVGNVNWKNNGAYYIVNVREVLFTENSKVSLSNFKRAIHSAVANCSVTAEKNSDVQLYSRDEQTVWMHASNSSADMPPAAAGNVNLTVKDGAMLDITGDGYGTGEDGATVTLVGYSGGYTVSGGGKLSVRSLCGMAGRPNTSGLGGQPALISQITSGIFNVSGEGSELFLDSYGTSNDYGATIRFRQGGGQQFNISDKGKAVIIKRGRSGGNPVAAIQFGTAPNNAFRVSSGGVVHVENFGNGTPADSGGRGANAGIQYLSSNFIFDVSDYRSAIEVIAHQGPAIDAEGQKDGSVTLGEGAIFLASGRTYAAPPGDAHGTAGRLSAVFVAGDNFKFTATRPLFYDFVNNRPGGGRIFRAGSGSTFSSTGSDVAFWGNGTNGRTHNPVSGDPYRAWTNISYTMGGEDFRNLSSSNDSSFSTDLASLGSNGMIPYTRICGNNASPIFHELFAASNADKYVRGRVTVPEGLNTEGRGAWTGEVWSELEVKPAGDGPAYKVIAGSLEGEDVYLKLDDTDKTHVDGVMRYEKGSFLNTGDTYRVLRVWRGDKDPNGKTHMTTPAEISATPITVVDKTPPTPPAITSPSKILMSGRANVSGSYTAVEAAHNPELTKSIHAVLVSGERQSVIKSGEDIVYATLDATRHTWSYTIPSAVSETLKKGDRIYFVATDENGNANPIGEKAYHDAVFASANFLTVADGPTSFTKGIVDPADNSKTLTNLTLSDPTQPISYRLSTTMPADMSEINSVEIRDVMGDGLTLRQEGGTAANVKATITPGAAGAPIPTISWDAATKTVSVKYEVGTAAQKSALQNKTITIDVTALLEAKDGVYATTAKNSGSLYLNNDKNYEITDPPTVTLKGRISGILFEDRDKDGIKSAGDPVLPGKSVSLLDASGNPVANATRQTAADGSYAFDNLEPGYYFISAQAISGAGFTTQKPLTEPLGSHVDNLGKSHRLTIAASSKSGLNPVANAGYAVPEVTPADKGGLAKSLVSVDGKATAGPITNSNGELVYSVSYTMPENTAGYNRLELVDVMAPGLVLKGGALNAANVVVTAEKNGSPLTVNPATGYPSYTAGKDGDSGKMVVTYRFADATDFSKLQGAKLTMTITANLEKVNGAWPTSVTNIGRLVVNGGESTTPPQTIDNIGQIFGTVFSDTNRNGQLDSGEAGLAGVSVALKKWDAAANGGKGDYLAWPDGAKNTQITPATGNYRFFVPAGKYQLVFPATVNDGGITTNGTVSGNTRSAPASGVVSDIEIALGDTTAQSEEVLAGYNKPNPDVVKKMGDSFAKKVNDGAGNWVVNRSITDSAALLEYRLSFTLPGNASDLAGFSSVKIQDLMPAGLMLADGADAAGNVVVTIDGKPIYTSTASGADAQSGNSASFSFDVAAIQAWKTSDPSVLGKEVAMTVKAKLVKVDGSYPSTVTNKGQLLVTGADALGDHELTVKNSASVSGTLWYDSNGDGTISSDEKGVGADQIVSLYAASDTAFSKPLATAKTNADGKFTLASLSDGNPITAGSYVIKYPAIVGHHFVLGTGVGGATNVKSATGASNPITLDLDANQRTVSNAGYRQSRFIDPDDPDAFTKRIISASGTASIDTGGKAATTTAPQSDVFTYRIAIKMPAQLYSYSTDTGANNGIEIRDVMGAGLVLAGSESAVLIKADGNEISGLAPVVAWDAFKNTLSVRIAAAYASLSKLENKTLTIDIPAKLQAADGRYPASVKNDAQIYLNGATQPDTLLPEDGKPSIHVKGAISGVLFTDANGNGIHDSADAAETALANRTVTLYAAADLKTPLTTAKTDAVGAYRMVVDAGSYVVQAPAEDGYGYTRLVDSASRDKDKVYSDVDNNGFSAALSIDRASNGANLAKTANAGYAKPQLNPDSGAFKKDLVAVGGTATTGPIHDSNADLTYQISYKMPKNSAGYNHLEILDIMDAGLVLKGGAVSDTNIVVTATAADGKEISVSGTASYTKGSGALDGKMVASFRLAEDTDFSKLAESTITIKIIANLEKVNGAWPTSVTNTGRLSVNNGEKPQLPDQPNTEENSGLIHGIAFVDSNRNGVLDAGEQGKSGVAATLEVWNGSAYVAYAAKAGDVATTDAQGAYRFAVPAGKYRLKFPTPLEGMDITTSGAGYVPATGVVEEIVIALGSASEQTRKLDVGYNTPDPSTGGEAPVITFTQYPLVIKQTPFTSHVLSAEELKAALQVTDKEDYPTWSDTDGKAQSLYKGMVVAPLGADGKATTIDSKNIGVYKVGYTATDSAGNKTTEYRAVVVDDGRYVIKDENGDGVNDIIVGARNFIVQQSAVQRSEDAIKSLSFAEAYTTKGDSVEVVLKGGIPDGYQTGKAPAGSYPFTWQAKGHSAEKAITGLVVVADKVDPGTKDSQYGIYASNFLVNTVQAKEVLQNDSFADKARAHVVKLVETAADKALLIADRGGFKAEQGSYPITFAIEGIPATSQKVTINGVVSNGQPPVIYAQSPLEVWIGKGEAPAGAITADKYTPTYAVSAQDRDGGGQGDPSTADDDIA
ncbi:MAG: isopeptide-forming domain-containing fimbrial protein [Coriobacteriales bacterium]|nr:isopeptide-forming domain-containing fimbrial protein [Coriobacteriales bacterium]